MVSLKELEEKEMNEDLKYSKKVKQNKRIHMGCEEKEHFAMMVPERYLQREGIDKKLLCPVCGKQLIVKSR